MDVITLAGYRGALESACDTVVYCVLKLTWLKAVPSTFQDVDFDVSLLPLVVT